jgi:hypothetical protein
MFHNLQNAVMCLWTWVGYNSALIAQTLARLHIFRTKNLENKTKKTQHLKLQLPHQVESSSDSIVRRHKSANRKSFLNSASEDENDTANEEPKVTRSAKRANIPDERTQKGNLISIMNLFSSTSTGSNDSRFCIITLLKNILDQSK